MNFLDILKGALSIVGDLTGLDILKNASKAIETIPVEKQAELQTALMAHQEAMASVEIQKLGVENEALKIQISEALAMVNSGDKFTSRARPFGVYAASVVTMAMGGAMIFGVALDTGAIATLLTPLWGSAAYYTYNRTKEKVNGNSV